MAVFIKDWDSRWYASSEKVGDLLVEDKKIRDFLKKKLFNAQVPKIEMPLAPARMARPMAFFMARRWEMRFSSC